MDIETKLTTPTAKKPTRESKFSAGYKLYADIPDKIAMHPGDSASIPTGCAFLLPEGFCGLITGPKMANGVELLEPENGMAVSVEIANKGDSLMWVQPGEVIATVVFTMYCAVRFVEEK